jgi:hypothetical protein
VARNLNKEHAKNIPVNVTNLPLTGVIHQDHTKPFHDYHGSDAPAPGTEGHAGAGQGQGQVDPWSGPTELVQKELQVQYSKLQGMQRQMAAEIQDKMEFVYQKLLREIEAQHLSKSTMFRIVKDMH